MPGGACPTPTPLQKPPPPCYPKLPCLRHFYLCGGESFNHWRELHLAEADGVVMRRPSRLAALVEGARMEGILQVRERAAERLAGRQRSVRVIAFCGVLGWIGPDKTVFQSSPTAHALYGQTTRPPACR
jgi:hypothetical protein